MKVIANKIWNEPAAFIGLLVSLGLLVVNLLGDPSWTAQEIIEVLAPLAAALGIRQLVRPDHGEPTQPAVMPQPTPKVSA